MQCASQWPAAYLFRRDLTPRKFKIRVSTICGNDSSVKIPATPRNFHYHMRMTCLTNADQSFQPNFLVLPPNVKKMICPVHMEYLGEHFNYIV